MILNFSFSTFVFLANCWFIYGVFPRSLAVGTTEAIAQRGFAGTESPVGYGVTAGGQGGKVFRVSTEDGLKTALSVTEKKIVFITGPIAISSKSLSVPSHTSLIGQGKSAVLSGHGFLIKSVSNVIIQNLKISKVPKNDGITLQNATRVWIDHNEFESIFHSEFCISDPKSKRCRDEPDVFDGQIDIVRASDQITVSWNYLHDHYKSSLVGNAPDLQKVDAGHLRVTYHHNFWKHEGTRGPAGRFGHQHVYNNLYEDFEFQAIHSRSGNQVLVEANVFRGKCTEALSTVGLVIPLDSPNSSVDGDAEADGFANLGAANDWGKCKVKITKEGTFTSVPYKYEMTPLQELEKVVKAGAGIGKLMV
ncbi:pectin lyase-like protein [Tothia fuscella]|uniref:Pectin lyase-like protein n=1 Tax=Tothia fuscella TaxID=1048955 RepID=A0A9P4P1Y5_9PEZI|nr:pectin lyase-like protein [Tothia fuscella]